MNHLKLTAIVFCAAGQLCLPNVSRADNFTTQATQTVQPGGQDWTYAIWTNGTVSTPVSATPGNTYELVGDGTLFENDSGATHIATPLPGANNVATFPGDSLTLDQDTELWCDQPTGGSGQDVTTLNFPGTNGNPGLILNGGVLWSAVSDGRFFIAGSIQVAQQSYVTLNTGTYAGEPSAGGGRYMNISGQLSGGGNLVLLDTEDEISLPQFPGNLTISGTSNTFSGQWIVTEGWLAGAGTHSLGTNSITVDPDYNLQQDPSVGGVGHYSPVNATFQALYPLNSAGTLTLTNNGQMALNQDCVFAAVVIQGASLAAGTYNYTYLANNFPSNFVGGGPGSLTVRPYTPTPGTPVIVTQPLPDMLYSGDNAAFSVSAVTPGANLPLTYQWQRNSASLADGGNISGSTNSSLVLTAVNSGNAGNYTVIVSSSAGSTTSSVVALTLVTPSGEPSEAAVDAVAPVAFYEFNDTNNPATGAAAAFDFVGGHTAIYGTGVQNGNPSYNIAGPTPATGWPGFSTSNAAAEFFAVSHSRVTTPPLNLDTNTVTLTAWVMPEGSESTKNAIIFSRAGTTVAGIEYTGYTANGNPVLGYTWNGEAGTSGWNSGITVPANQWSFVALSVTPTNATLYVINTNGLAASTHVYDHVNQAFDGATLIGDDSADGDNGGQSFIGVIDDVAAFNTSLSQGQLVGVYAAASGVSNFPPIIETQPQPQSVYPNQTAQFTVTATAIPSPSYQWQIGGVNLTDGGNISGSTNSSLILTDVDAGSSGNYSVIVSNAEGSVTSSVVALSLLGAIGEGPYELAVDNAGPVAFYEFNDTNDPATGSASAYDFVGQFTGTYGTNAQNGNPKYNVAGPTPATGWPGFSTTNAALETFDLQSSFVTTPPLNLNTNTVTLTAWVMPQGFESTKNAIIFSRAGGTVAGLEYTGLTDANANPILGYTWNNDPATFGWNSEITVPEFQWSFVALTVTPTNATISIFNANGVVSSTHVYNHVNQSFSGPTLIGGDSAHTTSQCFIGSIDDAAIFNKSLSQNQLLALYAAGSGVSNFPPIIAGQPESESLFSGQTAQFTVAAGSSQPLIYQWQAGAAGSGGPYTNLTDGGQISGSATPTLTITNISTTNALDYVVFVTNSLGSALSSPATLTVSLSIGPATNWVMASTEATGADWNTAVWTAGSVTNVPAQPASYAAEYLGSTFEILPGGLLRTPASASTATFPGNVLTVDGTATLGGSGGPGTTTNGFIETKQANPGFLNFPRLVMNGGGINVQNSGVAVFGGGQMVIASNTPIFYSGSSQHGVEIDSLLSGNGTIQYWNYGSAFQPTFTEGLNVTGASNTFTGAWLVEAGTLLGSGLNSLGTNTITVFTNAALETTYDIHNPAGLLILNGGRVYLHQNDSFLGLQINSNYLAPGTYTYAQLHSSYTNFPASWTALTGSSFSTASGSITVLGPSLSLQVQGRQLNWPAGEAVLLQATNILGPWVTNNATPPYTFTPTNPATYYRLKLTGAP